MRGIRHSFGSWLVKNDVAFLAQAAFTVMKTPVEPVIQTGKAAGSMFDH